MDVRIGVTYTPKEIDVELAEGSDPAKVRADVESAMGGKATMLWMTDRKGRQVGVPVDKLAYVEIGTPADDRRIGFANP